MMCSEGSYKLYAVQPLYFYIFNRLITFVILCSAEWLLEIDPNAKMLRMRFLSKLRGRELSKAQLAGNLLVQGAFLGLADF